MYEFKKLEVYQLALQYTDMIYSLTEKLPKNEEHNLESQIIRAVTSVVLNIAEGSTGQSDADKMVSDTEDVHSLIEHLPIANLTPEERISHCVIGTQSWGGNLTIPVRELAAARRINYAAATLINSFLGS
jgi:23S rRNA-intervening sequence protein